MIDIGWDVVSKREMVSWGSIGTIRFWSLEIVTSSSLFDDAAAAVLVGVDAAVAWGSVKADSRGDDDDDDDELSLVDKYRLVAAAVVSPDDNDTNDDETAEETVALTVKPRNAIKENFIFITNSHFTSRHLKGFTWVELSWLDETDECDE